MGEIYLDGQKWNEDLADDAVLADALNKIDIHIREQKRIICDVLLDGRRVDLNSVAQMKLSETDRIEIRTDEPVRFALETAGDASEYATRLIAGFEDFCKRAKAGDNAGGLAKFRECLPGLDWLSQVVPKSIGVMITEEDEKEFCDEIIGSLDKYSEVLKHTLEILEGGDLFEAGDHVQHELIPLLFDWQQYLDRAIAEAAGTSGSAEE